MPRNVRNFWIEASVDGRGSDIATGPRSSGGGFSCTIYVREEGSISDKKLRIGGQSVNGKNILSVELVENGGITKELRLEVNRDEAPKPKKAKVSKAKLEELLMVIDGNSEEIEQEFEKSEPPQRTDAFWRIIDPKKGN